MSCRDSNQHLIDSLIVRKRKMKQLADILNFERNVALKSDQPIIEEDMKIFTLCDNILNGIKVDDSDLRWMKTLAMSEIEKLPKKYTSKFLFTLPQSMQTDFLSYIPCADKVGDIHDQENINYQENIIALYLCITKEENPHLRYTFENDSNEETKRVIIQRLKKLSIIQDCQFMDANVMSLKFNHIFPDELFDVVNIFNSIILRLSESHERPLTFNIYSSRAVFDDFLIPLGYVATYDTQTDMIVITIS